MQLVRVCKKGVFPCGKSRCVLVSRECMDLGDLHSSFGGRC